MDKVKKHFDNIAPNYNHYKQRHSYYYDNLKMLLSDNIPRSSEVCEIGCATGNLLAYLDPHDGFGVDISSRMVRLAKLSYQNNKNLKFSRTLPKKKYQFVFMSDVIEHVENPLKLFSDIRKIMKRHSRLIITMANPIWEPVLLLAENLRLKMPEGPHFRYKYKSVVDVLHKSGFIVLKHNYKLLIPINIPFLTKVLNKYFERYLKKFCFIEYFVVKRTS